MSITSSDPFTSFPRFVLQIINGVRRLNWHKDTFHYHIATMEGIKETFTQCKKENRVGLHQSMAAGMTLSQSSSGHIIDAYTACFRDLYHSRISYGGGDCRYTAGHGSWRSRLEHPTITTSVGLLTSRRYY